MDFATLETMRDRHPAWRLLTADHAPLIASFLHAAFLAPNARALPERELALRLEDHLHALRLERGEGAFPRSAPEYLTDWAQDRRGWLRKFYPADTDEPHFDLTPAAERALRWLGQLTERTFVGTESRLLTVFHLLTEMVQGTETDPAARVAELEREKAELEAELTRARAGHLELMEPSALKDRFTQMADTARGLLADFRELEDHFRALDRSVRERIATWEGTKGALLEDVFGERDALIDSDQGKSFHAFWDFLMSPARQEELTRKLERVLADPAVQSLGVDPRLGRIHFDWLEQGEHTQRTVARLSEQLRRYLDDRTVAENRRILQVVRGVETHALAVRARPPAERSFMELDSPSPDLELPFERPLFTPPTPVQLAAELLEEGVADLPADALFALSAVDRARLVEHVQEALRSRHQVTLGELVARYPLEYGLAELVTYLALAHEDRRAVVEETRAEAIHWTDTHGRVRRATLPLVLFTR